MNQDWRVDKIYPNNQMTQHLQIVLTPTEYQAITQRYSHRGDFFDAEDDYWEHVPTYLIARCPLCAANYMEKLDTYSLKGWWVNPNSRDSIYARGEYVRRNEERERMKRLAKQGKLSVQKLRKLEKSENWVPKSVPQQIGCSHFVAVQIFINLNSVIPKELDYFSNESEVSFAMSTFLPDDVESYAVMHSLPICRVEDNQFVPRYLID